MRKLQRIPISSAGLDALVAEQSELRERRKTAVINLKTARDLGDLSENGLYKGARAELSRIDGRLRQLEYQIKLADVVKVTPGVIGIGSSVTLSSGDKLITYEIVGTYEADPLNKKISLNSPIGKKLLGKSRGDTITVETESRKTEYTIQKVS